MGKRSSFPRRERDKYPTPLSAVLPLLECLPPHTKSTNLVNFFGRAEFAIADPKKGAA